MSSYYYITSPIYYVNDVPHIGHAYTSIACDVMARFMRLSGKNVKFLTGTDEHGQKVEKSAELKNQDPQKFVDEVSQRFRDLSSLLNLSNDDFIRTSEERHKLGATALWNKLLEKEYIYLGKYSGWYSVRDESFFLEKDLVDGKAPTGAPVEWVEESSYFFALSKFQDKLLDFYQDNPDFIQPESRFNEVVSFVKSGLQDLSVSRTSFKWGIKVSQNPEHVMYVWLDALTNYISALGYPETTDLYKNFWPADIHVVGKDILRFHAVFWPAFLMAADLPCPKKIFAHGWWTIDGEKMSKSIGNVVAPQVLVEDFGLDQTRYFLMREIPFGQDGNFSRIAMQNRINGELANNIGNLAQRTLSFINKNAEGRVPLIDIDKLYKEALLANIKEKIQDYHQNMNGQKFNLALEAVIEIANTANGFIETQAPWALRKTNPERMFEVLYMLIESIRYIAILLLPFMPDSMNKLLDFLAVDIERRKFSYLNQDFALSPGIELPAPSGIFPRINLDL
ncbi:MAG: methionine--tRNA ligase [Pseudomonadota bacterium]